MKQLEDENRRLKSIVVDLTLDKAMLRRKRLKPARLRTEVSALQRTFGVSERRACHVTGARRTTQRFVSASPRRRL
ncbi:MAG: hypothetical protein P1V36_14350 [Planctomycetota bacterium]|nr:hypothetical protein [Planctomycetota bacterium]